MATRVAWLLKTMWKSAGTPAEAWTVTSRGALRSGEKCLASVQGKPAMQACKGQCRRSDGSTRWREIW